MLRLVADKLDRDQPQDYMASLRASMELRLGVSDAMSEALSRLGWECFDAVLNSVDLQERWLLEHGSNHLWALRMARRFRGHARLPVIGSSLQRTIVEQVESLKPDVTYVHDLDFFSDRNLSRLMENTNLLVGQSAVPIRDMRVLRYLDVFVSALPSNVAAARAAGVGTSLFLPHAFDVRVLSATQSVSKDIDVLFTGSIGSEHAASIPLIQAVARTVGRVHVLGAQSDAVRRSLEDAGAVVHAPVWGLDMYKSLARARVVLNRHADFAGRFAANMRLFEVTGVGSALVTDAKSNLNDLFDVGSEVIAYESFEDAGRKTADLLDNPARLEGITLRGQARTLKSHTYADRARILNKVLRRALAN